jgi:hypothetical protein
MIAPVPGGNIESEIVGSAQRGQERTDCARARIEGIADMAVRAIAMATGRQMAIILLTVVSGASTRKWYLSGY